MNLKMWYEKTFLKIIESVYVFLNTFFNSLCVYFVSTGSCKCNNIALNKNRETNIYVIVNVTIYCVKIKIVKTKYFVCVRFI